MGNRSRFANHDDNPNARTRIMTVRGDHHIQMYAAAPIERGEEIFFDYRYDREERRVYGFQGSRGADDGNGRDLENGHVERKRKRGRPPGPSRNKRGRPPGPSRRRQDQEALEEEAFMEANAASLAEE